MGSGKPTEDKVLSSAALALGLKDSSHLAKLDLKALARFTQRQLFECAKRLQLKGSSKLSKGELAERVAEAIAAREAPSVSGSPVGKGRQPAVETAEPEALKAVKEGDLPEPVLSHKFELGERGKSKAPETIPWSYGYDRVTGMAVDPDRLFVYWEVTDDGIGRARQALGAGGKDAWLSLRIYDTTDRIFDGTNAHSYFDHRIERGDRHWFFHIAKPTSSAFVDIGMKSSEGYFAKIGRTGRIEFPRKESAAWGEPEWLSVRSMLGSIEHAGRGPHVRRHAPGIAPAAAHPPTPDEGQRRHVALLPWEESFLVSEGGRKDVYEWEEYHSDGTTEFHRELTWESPVMVSAWEAGPFAFPVSAPEPVREDFTGPSRVYRVGGKVHIVHGPWQVVIRGLGAHHGRSVIARWEIYRSWVSEEKSDGHGADMREVKVPGSSERLFIGASERRWRYASEMRLGGASEVFLLGASEIRARGASERIFAGASQYVMRGASERRFAGASEVRMRGASERMLGGASERMGSSERMLGGASERMGASENMLGGSEARLVGGPPDIAPPAPEGGHYPTPESFGKQPEHKD
jgi:hypothetical protein